ncbi:hypothetical protein KQ236_10680 [Lactococcus lactis]|nr:hypothetical protein [Lactococcus lactis]
MIFKLRNRTENVIKNVQATAKELIEKIDIELEKYVAPVPKKSMTMKERIDKEKMNYD